MIIVFNCPHCAAILRMKEQYGGQRGRCPHCQGAITVPAIETDAGMDLIPLEGSAPASAPVPAAPAPAASPSPFSIESRLRLLGGGPSEPGEAPARASDTGDSNIGLAPVDDHPAPVAKAPAPAAPARPKVEANEDDNFALAPLEEIAEKPASRAPAASAAAPASTNGAAAKESAAAISDSKGDLRLSVVCDGCGARMRVSPNAAGKQLTCPRCKKKLRVPDAPEPATTPASLSDTRSAHDTSSSSHNLDIGALDGLEASAPAAADAPAAPLRAPGGKGKGKAKAIGQPKSNGSTLLGMPPLAVYGGAATALIAGLAIVYVMTKPAATSGPTPTAVAQTQAPAAKGQPPAAPTPSAPLPGTSPPAVSQPTAPQPGMPSAGPGTPEGQSPPVVATPTTPAAPAANPAPAVPLLPAAPAAGQRVEWRNRIPVVRMVTGRHKTEPALEEGATEVPLLTVPSPDPRPPEPSAAEIKALVKVAPQVLKSQEQIRDLLKQMASVAAAKQIAPLWAEQTAQGLELIRQDQRLRGVSMPSKDAGTRMQTWIDEETCVVQAQAELERLAQLPGAIEALSAALQERAAREPTGALADTLKQAVR